jgi:hypothetical protein
MGNVSGTPEKLALRKRLFEIGIQTLEDQGYVVERVPRAGKSSKRRITKSGDSKIVAIRTMQDAHISFPRTTDDSGWTTLSDVDVVVAVSVDDREHPKFAVVHQFDGDVVQDHFDRAFGARRRANFAISAGQGMWISLYDAEGNDPVTLVGAGLGLKYPSIAQVPLDHERSEQPDHGAAKGAHEPRQKLDAAAPLTISEAKHRLALALGVSPDSIKITVEA